uniref:Lipocalin/cytosolic fatty-acid binding domain-containing protein n=1 Tax=Amblyomma maculatum TaxID=34609 RepID=G3MQN9_AMBMU
MRSSSIIFFVVTKLFLLSLAGAVSRGPNKLQREVPDTFKIFEAFPHPVGVMDIDNDTILDCLSARRAEMDPEAQTATYVWSLAGSEGKTRAHVPVYHMPGDSPDATRYSVGSKDGPVEVGYFRYTDYKDCAILELPHFGDQCTLWVSEEVRDSIPAECLEQYADICGEGAPIYDKEMCEDADK